MGQTEWWTWNPAPFWTRLGRA
ncbi:uncharacterized protein G2W53_034195 [Senna tora]|uniref:Uncharacterized protein n=1 Tax=Senna tora TaxID=362788 RepID=A0A834SZW1_9FABA|nr:uncharacterized protein G2W53_034195 [Senna tora]